MGLLITLIIDRITSSQSIRFRNRCAETNCLLSQTQEMKRKTFQWSILFSGRYISPWHLSRIIGLTLSRSWVVRITGLLNTSRTTYTALSQSRNFEVLAWRQSVCCPDVWRGEDALYSMMQFSMVNVRATSPTLSKYQVVPITGLLNTFMTHLHHFEPEERIRNGCVEAKWLLSRHLEGRAGRARNEAEHAAY